jgi:hypothetical protein
MTLEDRYKSLGIDREAITKACADPVSTAVTKEPTYFQLHIGPRVKAPPIEDMSRFIDEEGQRMSKRLRKAK